MIHVINFKYDLPDGAEVINTTSRSTNWSRGLSPFFVGPIDLYQNYKSVNMENCWQFSKVYEYYLQPDGSVGESYFNWAQKGWLDVVAHRYPMGKDVKPLFSYWDGEQLDYVSARKKIYIPLYAKAIKKTNAFQKLQSIYQPDKDLYLQDFDAHNLKPGSFDYWGLCDNQNIKFGHAYVLAMLLEGLIK